MIRGETVGPITFRNQHQFRKLIVEYDNGYTWAGCGPSAYRVIQTESRHSTDDPIAAIRDGSVTLRLCAFFANI